MGGRGAHCFPEKDNLFLISGETMNPGLKSVASVEGTRSLAARETLTAAVLRVATLYQVSQADLGRILGLSAASVSRMAAGRYLLDPEGKEWQFAALLVRLFRSLDSITGGNDELSRQWLRNYNAALSATPVSLLGEITGLVNVVQYLDASRAVV